MASVYLTIIPVINGLELWVCLLRMNNLLLDNIVFCLFEDGTTWLLYFYLLGHSQA